MYTASVTTKLQTGATYDVIIVGARAAGAATGMLLARAGLRPLVIDRSAPGTDTLSTHAILRGGVLQLSRWGLLDRIVAAGTPPIQRTTFIYAEERLALDLKPSHGVDALYAPRRTVLDPTLVDAAVEAGCEVHHGTSVTSLLWEGDRVAGVRAVTADSRTVDLRARLVIGADGIRSMVAREVDAATTRLGNHAGAATYGYWTDFDSDGFEWMFRPEACAGVIPTNDGAVCVFAGASPNKIGRGGTKLIQRVVDEVAPDVGQRLAAATPPQGTRTWSGHVGFMKRPYGRGWALVGDAGYFKDPIGAHGLTDALRDAELLGRAIVQGWNDESELTDALADYESTRDRLSVELFDIIDRVAGQQWDDREIAELLWNQSKAMVDEVETLAALGATSFVGAPA
jgi:flavin-dependent dehydrogenase